MLPLSKRSLKLPRKAERFLSFPRRQKILEESAEVALWRPFWKSVVVVGCCCCHVALGYSPDAPDTVPDAMDHSPVNWGGAGETVVLTSLKFCDHSNIVVVTLTILRYL